MNVNVTNMFAAKKVKLHGMMSSKWTTHDKIVQYKGLINLYTRDRKIMELDTNISKKKLHREIKDLAKSVHTDRRELDNAIRGDKQKLRNTLSEHRELQLAYQNSHPKKVIEEIFQRNFKKRKVLDRLSYEKKIKTQKLIDLKLEQAELEDRLKYRFLGQIQQEKDAQIIAGLVQDAILRKEAAAAILRVYKEILDIMKKDALYFDVIIATVKNDSYAQSKCFLGATTLGQLATEYLDDRRQEFQTLENMVKKDMATRKADIKVLKNQVENASSNIKQLIRKDSDVTTCMVHVSETDSMKELHAHIDEVENVLKFLKNATLVPSYEAIYPCLQEQTRQHRRLKLLAKKCEKERDYLMNKKNHAELMNSMLKSTMNEDIAEYQQQKQMFMGSIEDFKTKKVKFDRALEYKRNVAAKIRIALTHLLQLSYNVKSPENMKKVPSHLFSFDQEKAQRMEIPENDETDGVKIIFLVNYKVGNLMSTYFSQRKEADPEVAYKNFEIMMQNRQIAAKSSDFNISATSLLEGLYTETATYLTREDIKKQSREIVAANTRNEDDVPMYISTKKKVKKFHG